MPKAVDQDFIRQSRESCVFAVWEIRIAVGIASNGFNLEIEAQNKCNPTEPLHFSPTLLTLFGRCSQVGKNNNKNINIISNQVYQLRSTMGNAKKQLDSYITIIFFERSSNWYSIKPKATIAPILDIAIKFKTKDIVLNSIIIIHGTVSYLH